MSARAADDAPVDDAPADDAPVHDARAAELAGGLARVRERITVACRAAGRDPDDVALTVVTKFFPASDLRLLAGLGVREVAENRHQEALTKSAELTDLGLRWHFVGGLQSNKAAALAAWADVVQSVDRTKLVAPLARGAEREGRVIDVLVQVSLDPPGAGQRAGAAPDDLPALADAVESADGLRLRGLMAVAPNDDDPARAFGRLAELHTQLVQQHPHAEELSAGMSGDLEAAVAAGATRVRVGSAILGSRPSVA